MDGIPVVMESFGLSLSDSDTFDAQGEGFKLPAALVDIEEEAFAGIPASRVEITENVKTIGPRAFGDCQNLRVLVIPETVKSIDDSAVEGCKYIITVYGKTGSEAWRFATTAPGCIFVATDSQGGDGDIEVDPIPASAPVVMPYVAF